jgi:sec-independent protein translocase protein TatA
VKCGFNASVTRPLPAKKSRAEGFVVESKGRGRHEETLGASEVAVGVFSIARVLVPLRGFIARAVARINQKRFSVNGLPGANEIAYSKCIMFGLGIGELLVILVIVLVIFGAGKLPDIGEGLGRGIRNFRKAVKSPDEIDVTPEQRPAEPSEKKS